MTAVLEKWLPSFMIIKRKADRLVMAQALVVNEMYGITHNYRLPRKYGGQKASTFLGVYIIFPKSQMTKLTVSAGNLNLNFGKKEKIPKGKDYVFVRLPTPEDAMETLIYGKVPSRLIPKPKLGDALEFEDWLNLMESKELTIADVEALKPGEEIHVIQLHRNLGDMVLDSHVNPEGVSIPASKFFLPVQGYYIHDYDLHGKFLDILDDEDGHMPLSFNFDLNYSGKSWYPLGDDGLLPVESGEYWIRNAVADYRKYPKTTKVGMRGPMLRVSDVEKAPPVYWHQEKFSFKFL